MRTETIQAIQRVLGEYALGNPQGSSLPNTFPGLQQRLLQDELCRETQALQSLLARPDEFEQAFKNRCIWRNQNPEYCLVFSEFPGSLTNQLYWRIALLLFPHSNLKDMLALMAPTLSELLTFEIVLDPQSLTELPVALKKRVGIRLVKTDLAAFAQEQANKELLSNYVIFQQSLLDLKSIENYHLDFHLQVHELLQDYNPKLLSRVYEHNAALEGLLQDIELMKNKGMTPMKAISRLIRPLITGGQRFTGGEFASKKAHDARDAFIAYFTMLPEEDQKALAALGAGAMNLGNVIRELSDSCVETTSDHLAAILKQNPHAPCLYKPKTLNPSELTALYAKYKKKAEGESVLNTNKDQEIIKRLPKALLKQAIKQTGPLKKDAFLDICFNFPKELYEDLIASQAPYLTQYLYDFAKSIAAGLFTEEQKEELARVIIMHYTKFNCGYRFIDWVIVTEDPIFIGHALKQVEEPLRAEYVLGPVARLPSLMYWACDKADILQTILKLLPKASIPDVLQAKIESGDTLLHRSATNPESLRLLLFAYKTHNLPVIVGNKNQDGDTLLHKGAAYPASLNQLLELVPDDLVEAELLQENTLGSSVLHRASISLESVARLLPLFSCQKKLLQAVTKTNQVDISVLHLLLPNPQRLQALFKQLDALSIDAVKIANKAGNTALHLVTEPACFWLILELYPKKEWVAALTQSNKNGQSPIALRGDNPVLIREILCRLQEDDLRLHWLAGECMNKQNNYASRLIEQKQAPKQGDPGFENSFIPQWLIIYAEIEAQAKKGYGYLNPLGFFGYRNRELQLQDQCSNAESVEKLKVLLHHYASENPANPITALIKSLIPSETSIPNPK